MADYNIQINRYNGSGYDKIFPKPASHASTHGANGSDPITVGTNNISNSAVTSGKIANNAVTKDKIADGAIVASKIGYGNSLPQDPVVGQLFLLKVG